MVSLEDLVHQLVERGGSDLHISCGAPPMMRIDGRLVPTETEVLGPETTRKLVYSIMDNQQIMQFEKELEGVVEVARRGGVPIAVISTPYRFQLEDPLGTRRPQDLMAKRLEELGVPFFDLLPELAAAPIKAHRDASHFSHAGHLAAARALYPWLRELL